MNENTEDDIILGEFERPWMINLLRYGSSLLYVASGTASLCPRSASVVDVPIDQLNRARLFSAKGPKLSMTHTRKLATSLARTRRKS